MVCRVFRVLLAMSLAGGLATTACGADYEGATIKDINFGKQLAGPTFNARTARGKVLYLVFWNANVAKSVEDAGEIFKLQESLGSEDILIMAYQNYEMPEEIIMSKWQEAGGPDQQVPLFYQTSFPKKFTGSKTPRLIIGPRGEVVFAGGPRDADQKLLEISMRMPGYIPGNREYKRLISESRQLERADRGIGRQIDKLRKIANGELESFNNPQAIEEAKFMLERIEAWVAMEQAKMDESLSGNPLPALEISQRMTKALRGSDMAEPFEETFKKFKRDRAMKDEIKAAEIWLGTMNMMEQVKLSPRSNKPDALKKIQNKDGQFTAQGQRILRGVVGLIKKYPETWGGREADQFARGVGLK